MGTAGLFVGERVELLYGYITEMSPIGVPHSAVIQLLVEVLIRALGERASVRPQSPFIASDESEPEPDIAVVPRGDGLTEHPRRAHLIIEVADSSLAADSGIKARLYAESGVPEYWVVNLRDWVVQVHTDPLAGIYSRLMPYRRGERIRLLRFPEVEIAVDEFLPEPPASDGDRG